MLRLVDLANRDIAPDDHSSREPLKIEVTSRCYCEPDATRDAEYEAEVFSFLFENKDQIGIRRVYRFKNVRVDGLVELDNKQLFVVEVKLRMNWFQACGAGWQFAYYLDMASKAQVDKVTGAFIFFEEFSGDWNRQPKSWKTKRGWNYWYQGHSYVQGLRMNLVRLVDGFLEDYPVT